MVARRLDGARRALAGGGDRHRRADLRRDRRDRGAAWNRLPGLDRRGDPCRGGREGGADVRAAHDLGPSGPGDRARHAGGPLRPPARPVLRVLRPLPDRPADVARDRRPAGGAVLPRLRAHLLLPARDHRRLGHRRARVRRLAPRADRPGDHADPGPRRVPLQPRLASDPARRPAASSGRSRRSPRSRSSVCTS